ncbi:MAG TPA: hypothetical protein VFZ48_00920 [Candidatus Saccharimonadales bacterium]
MALFLQQKDGKSELQERVASELKSKLQQNIKTPPVKDEPAMLENQSTTRTAGVVIMALLVILVCATLVWVTMLNR